MLWKEAIWWIRCVRWVRNLGFIARECLLARHYTSKKGLMSSNPGIMSHTRLEGWGVSHQGGADLRSASEGILWMPIRYGERNRRFRHRQTGGLPHRGNALTPRGRKRGV